jgi:conjugative transposon TraM protein
MGVDDGIDWLEGSLYTEEEMRAIDSITMAARILQEERATQSGRFQLNQNFQWGELDVDELLMGEDERRPPPTRSRMQEEMEIFRQQMRYIDSIQNPERFMQQQLIAQLQNMEMPEEIPPVEVVRLQNVAANHFNTVGGARQTQRNAPIMAILDETITVVSGSRVRIRLLDDITVGEHTLRRGQYLFGNVSGFTAQRVRVNVNSLLIDNELVVVDLAVFDNDGQEGFFVPASRFRDATRQIGAGAANQRITIQNSTDQLEAMLFQTLQQATQTAGAAVQGAIRQNRATLKYGTHVYLINSRN